jgi:hypothetical protein
MTFRKKFNVAEVSTMTTIPIQREIQSRIRFVFNKKRSLNLTFEEMMAFKNEGRK